MWVGVFGVFLNVEFALVSFGVGVDVFLSLVVDWLVKMFLDDFMVVDVMLMQIVVMKMLTMEMMLVGEMLMVVVSVKNLL